jgi:predicted transcriptional regulator
VCNNYAVMLVFSFNTRRYYRVITPDGIIVSSHRMVLSCHHTRRYYRVITPDGIIVSSHQMVLSCHHTRRYYRVITPDGIIVSSSQGTTSKNAKFHRNYLKDLRFKLLKTRRSASLQYHMVPCVKSQDFYD